MVLLQANETAVTALAQLEDKLANLQAERDKFRQSSIDLSVALQVKERSEKDLQIKVKVADEKGGSMLKMLLETMPMHV